VRVFCCTLPYTGADVLAAAVTRRATCPDGNTASNEACCVLFPIIEDLQENFFFNECGDGAHQALRISFHDAIGFSTTDPSFGCALFAFSLSLLRS
jgi:hypothetical protein